MKTVSYLKILLPCAMLLGFSSCVKENFGPNQPVEYDGLVFGAMAGYGTPDTKTIYGDYLDANGNPVDPTEQKPASQEIEWVANDSVSIYSPQSPSVTDAIYMVGNNSGPNATLVYGNSGKLQWGNESTQDFYAVYPAPLSIDNASIRNIVSFNEGKLTGYIPVNQYHEITNSGPTGWTAQCNMQYSYMTAVNEDVQVSDDNNGVSLAFKPISTTLELTIKASSDVNLNSLNIIAENDQPIAGRFTCDLVNGEFDADGYPMCEYAPSTTVQNMITVPLYYLDGDVQKPIKLSAGQSITLNIFLLPHEAHTSLTLRLSILNAASRTLDLSTKIDKISPHKKTRVTVTAPAASGSNNWVGSLDKDIYLSQLSIPGSANSFSYLLSDSYNYNKTQTKTIEEQWNAGVRCFELRGPNNTSGNSLAEAQLQCGRQNIGITFGDAVDEILSLLEANPDEFVMIMPALETDDGHMNTGNERKCTNIEDYVRDLNEFYDALSLPAGLHLQTYNPELTVGDMTGAVMFVARITSEEDSDDIINELHDIGISQGMAINQWGSLKDYWGRRGYTVNGNRAANWSKNYSASTDVEYYMLNGNTTYVENVYDEPTGTHLTGNTSFSPSSSLGVPNKPIGDLSAFQSAVDYTHTSYRSDGSDGTVFLQEWSRVVPERNAGNYYLYTNNDGGVLWGRDWRLYWAYWGESYTEKQADVWNTFMLCQEQNSRAGAASGNQYSFFINSLDGYYVSPDVGQSYWPYIESNRPDDQAFGRGGMAGDIASYAQDINTWFYNRILTYGVENISGPLNLIILDRVLDGTPGGDYLPQVIIDNNFKFPLQTKGSSSASFSYEPSGKTR